MRKKVVNKYKMKSKESIVIPNEELLEMSEEEEIVVVLNQIFRKIEQPKINVMEILVSPQIEELFSKRIGKEFYESRYIWTAHIKIVDGLKK